LKENKSSQKIGKETLFLDAFFCHSSHFKGVAGRAPKWSLLWSIPLSKSSLKRK